MLPMQIWILLISSVTVHSIRLETKLDFQGESSERPKLLEPKEVRVDPKIELDCSPTGCNATKVQTKSDSPGVVIEIKTTLDTKNDTTKKEDVPDIPIVPGYGGLNDNSLYPVNTRPLIGSFDVRNGNNFVPSFGVPHQKPVYEPRKYVPSYGSWTNNRGVHTQYGARPDWRSVWNQRRPEINYHYNRYPPPATSWTKCDCHPNTARWYPTTLKPLVLRPGNQVNDKLGPLN